MKYFSLIMLLVPSLSLALPCKILRTDGVVLYGECEKIEDVAVFRSCFDFSCKVNQSLTRPLEFDEKGCVSKPLKHKEFKEYVLKEHKVKNVKDIKACNYN